MNLVLGLLVTSASGVLIWSGITNPEGGTFAGIGRMLRGEPEPERVAGPTWSDTVAALSSGGVSGAAAGGLAGGKGGKGGGKGGAPAGGGKPAGGKSGGNGPTVVDGITLPDTSTGLPDTVPNSVYPSLGRVQPYVAKAANEIGPMFGIVIAYGYRASATDMNGHPAGKAVDFMVKDARGTALARYALANKKRLRVSYVIWRQRINSGDGRGWRAMEDRGDDTANHMDHVHVNFT